MAIFHVAVQSVFIGGNMATNIANSIVMGLFHVFCHHVRMLNDLLAARMCARYGISAMYVFHVCVKVYPIRKFSTTQITHLTFGICSSFELLPGTAGVPMLMILRMGVEPGRAMTTLVLDVTVMLFIEVIFIFRPRFGLKVGADTALAVVQGTCQ